MGPASKKPAHGEHCLCERSVGTVFQLPNPDAIYSRDEEKERGWLPSGVVCVRARFTRQGGGRLPR
jgi:hypothetical protein